METFSEEMPVDEILQHIRDAIIDNERKKYFRQFLAESAKKKAKPDEDVFLLSQNMMVNREDIPYQLGVWSFDDVAKKIMKKYRTYFAAHWQNQCEIQNTSNHNLVGFGRVSVKESNI